MPSPPCATRGCAAWSTRSRAGRSARSTSILHIGIGGSALGPDLVIDALGRDADRYDVRVLANIDGEAFDEAVTGLDPATTLVVGVSKTFTTIETLTNLDAALEWLREGGVEDPHGQLIAVTAAPDAAVAYGIDETRILPFGEGVGGRYCLWSTVGLSIALALGWGAFEELLEGAAEMDRHVRLADDNIALTAAFADLLYAQLEGAETRAVFAYDERLRLLPDYLQQLEMESNGKSATADGAPLGPQVGADHLGRGRHRRPARRVPIAPPGHAPRPGRIRRGDRAGAQHGPAPPRAAARQLLRAGRGADGGQGQRRCGARLSGQPAVETLLLDRLDARTLGALIAFYEHRTFANAVLLGINPFDQFGVELGKEMAKKLDDEEGPRQPRPVDPRADRKSRTMSDL